MLHNTWYIMILYHEVFIYYILGSTSLIIKVRVGEGVRGGTSGEGEVTSLCTFWHHGVF